MRAESTVDHRPPEPQRPDWEPPQGVTVGAAHDPAEHQADALAARVLRKLSRPDAPAADPGAARAESCQPDDSVHRAASGGAIAGEFEADASTSRELRGRIGKGRSLDGPVRKQMESAFGTSLAGVKVHRDEGAGRLADSIGAEAFTHGKDVFFGRDRFNPDSSSGQALLVHELAHVVQGGGQQPVRRKLKGTHAAVAEGKGKAGKGERFFKTDYAKILEKLKDFEKREDLVLAQKNFGKLGKDRFWMEKTLRSVIKMVDEWLAENDKLNDPKAHSAANNKLVEMGTQYEMEMRSGNEAKMLQYEKEAKGGKTNQRARVLSMLRPRLVAELQDISDPVSYFQGKQLADTHLDRTTDFTKDDAVGGAQNRLDRLQYQDGKKGYFIADKSDALLGPDVGGYYKLEQIDPQMGARSVASSRLAKLFGSNEIVDVQFAVHSSKTGAKGKPLKESLNKLGVFSEVADGTEATQMRYATTKSERKDYESRNEKSKVIDTSDPTLQRGLNVLQMLDYISLQVDRHAGNYYITTDQNGKVLGVKGIDLDQSFGQGGKGGNVDALGHFVGVPQLADAKFRQKVLQVSPDEVKKCLDGLISPTEVSACLDRFAHLQKVMREIDPKKIVQEGGWGAETAKEQVGKSNYLEKLRVGTIGKEYNAEAEQLIKPVYDYARNKIREGVAPAVEKGLLSPGQGKAVVRTLANSFITSPFWERLRTQKNQANDARSEAKQAHAKLVEDRKALQPGTDTKDIDEQVMAAELASKVKEELSIAAGKEHDDAVASFIKGIVDYAVRRANRQKSKQPQRRPSLGAHRQSTGANV
jgi:hypothetical protein